VIPGLVGLRKTRLKSAGKGKRGSFRVDYLYIPERGKLYLLILYAKNVKEDLSEEEKKQLSKIVVQIKKQQKMGKMFDMLYGALTDVLEYELENVKLHTKKLSFQMLLRITQRRILKNCERS
jgi:hypothetical protein